MVFYGFGIILVLLFTMSYCVSPEPNRSYYQKSYFVDHCDKLYSLACFKLDAANWLDKFGTNSEFVIIPGVSLLQNPNSVKVYTSDIAAQVARDFPDDNSKADQILIRRLMAFLSEHSLKVNLSSVIPEEFAVTGRKEKDKKGDGGIGMILIAGTMTIGVLTALAMAGLTALAGKALITGLVSFVLSAIIGLKQLTSSKEKTYITQPVPVYTPSHEGWEEYTGHRRSTPEVALPKGLKSDYSPA